METFIISVRDHKLSIENETTVKRAGRHEHHNIFDQINDAAFFGRGDCSSTILR